MTHAAQLVAAIRRSRKGMTYGESLHREARKSDGLVVFRIVRRASA